MRIYDSWAGMEDGCALRDSSYRLHVQRGSGLFPTVLRSDSACRNLPQFRQGLPLRTPCACGVPSAAARWMTPLCAGTALPSFAGFAEHRSNLPTSSRSASPREGQERLPRKRGKSDSIAMIFAQVARVDVLNACPREQLSRLELTAKARANFCSLREKGGVIRHSKLFTMP